MSLFDFFTEKIAIDLGTSNTVIMHKGKIAIDHPSIVAMDKITGKIKAVGKEANFMEGRLNKNTMQMIYPLKNGVISKSDAATHMLQNFAKQTSQKGIFAGATRYDMIISIPYQTTQVELKAVCQVAERINAKKIYLIPEPIAAAIGGGIDVLAPNGNMVVDIGGGTTEIAAIALGKIIHGQSLKIAGNTFDDDIIAYIRKNHNLAIGRLTAEKTKWKIGAALPDIEHPPKTIRIHGLDILTGKPKQIDFSHSDMAECLDKSLSLIENAIIETLSQLPPELSADIFNSGIFLTGGGSLLHGLIKRLRRSLELPIYTEEHPLKSVVKGNDIVLENLTKYQKIVVYKNAS